MFPRLLAAAGLLLPLAAAQAALTPVNPNGAGNGAERCLAGATCAQGAYAGAPSIVRAFETDLGLAAGSLQRVDDGLDQLWTKVSGDAALRPIARYAGDNSKLGVSSGGPTTLLAPTLASGTVLVDHPGLFAGTPHAGDFALNADPWVSIPLTSPFAFVLKNLTSALTLSSATGLAGFSNSGYAQDWMVTYRVPGQNLYLMAWEDRRSIGANGLPNDWDYNDYVFEVRGVAPYTMTGQGDPAPAPLAPALGFMLAGLGALGATARRRAA
jgi:hypothetical protein